MRHTLSVLTAVCLLALGQPAWSETSERDIALRARTAALSLPAEARASASQVLRQLQAQQEAPAPRRPLPLHPMVQAVHQTLAQDYDATANTHLLPKSTLPLRWHGELVPVPEHAFPRMHLDTAMVERWLAPWLADCAT